MGLLEVSFVFASVFMPPTDSTETIVLSRVEAFAEAFQTGDVETITDLLGSNYSHCNSSGSRPTREQWLAWYSTRAEEIRSGRFTYTEYRIDDVNIQVYDTVAVATMVNSYVADRAGERVSGRLLITQVWSQEDGKWKRIAFHDSRIPDEARGSE